MVSPTATCELWMDGVRVPDAGVDLLGRQPTALSGLTLSWGRDGPWEQPGPATLTVDILDAWADADFLDQLHVGSPVQTWAEGTIPGGGEGWGPNSFDPAQAGLTYPDGPPPAGTVTSTAGDTLTIVSAALRADQPGPGLTVGPILPPRLFSPVGELPTAWDDIPQARPGQTWQLSATVTAPAGVPFTLRPALYTAPYESGAVAGVWTLTPASFTGTGAPLPVTLTATLQQIAGGTVAAGWLAVQIAADVVTGRGRWSDMVGTWADQVGSWDDYDERGTHVTVDTIAVQPPGSGTTRRVLVFSGAVSDVKAVPDAGGLLYTVTAADLGADLGNRVVGDDPWPAQGVAARADVIAGLAGITTTPRVRVDPPLDQIEVSWRDVDAQPAYTLLQDLATTCGGVLWAATHAVTGPFLWIENPNIRTPAAELELVDGIIVIVAAARDVTAVSACDVLLDGVEWWQDTQDTATVVAVTWTEQTVDDDGLPAPTERTVTLVDEAALDRYGTRRLSISTELTSEAEAEAMASRALTQARAVGWRLDGLTLDTATMPEANPSLDDATRAISLLTMLDGTARMGLPLTLVDMPAYAPRGSVSSYYLEGGKYAYTGGWWQLQLAASPSAGLGTSATWDQLDPAWTWAQWSPTIQWQDLYGVGP